LDIEVSPLRAFLAIGREKKTVRRYGRGMKRRRCFSPLKIYLKGGGGVNRCTS